jgi:hypothetical protein
MRLDIDQPSALFLDTDFGVVHCMEGSEVVIGLSEDELQNLRIFQVRMEGELNNLPGGYVLLPKSRTFVE